MEHHLALLADPSAWIALITLILMEVILGIDNLIFIAILSNKLPPEHRVKARRCGLAAALVLRILLLASIAWIVQLTDPILTVMGNDFSWKDLILIAGGVFLLWKATKEIHHKVDPHEDEPARLKKSAARGFYAAIAQILLLDLVFSIDSIITAVGMTDHVAIMIVAVLVAVGLMMLAATPLSNFINAHPTIVMLALSFLIMIGMTLVAEGFGMHVPKGYIYSAMAFSASVEALNIWSTKKATRKKKRK